MQFPEHIFRSYDIRGLLEEVTPELAKKIGQVLVQKTQAKTVVAGRDMRATSPELLAAAIQGLTEAGANVIDIGFCTTSLFNFAVSSFDNVEAGIMITASHNPAKYNGIKSCFGNGQPISGKSIRESIEQDFVPAVEIGLISKINPVEEYLKKCLTTSGAPDLSGTKIVVDYGNGAGVVTVRLLLEKMNAEVIELYPEPDAHFPNHEANPAKEETLNDLKAAVVRENAAFGIALDGDADRVVFVDNEGVSVPGDFMLALLAKEVLSKKSGAKIITSPNQSWSTFDAISENNGQILSAKIGRTNFVALMKEQKADLGGEVSGHFFWQEFSDLESVDYTIVRIISFWKKSEQTFADLVRPLRKFVNSGEVNLEIHNKEAALKKLEENYASQATVVDHLDGIRCEFNRDWWFIARLSNTEPILRLTIEAKTEELMNEKKDELVKLISE